MKLFKTAILALTASILFFSCKKDDPVECFVDPRTPALGTYSMTDSVFFLSEFNEVINYEMVVRLDTLTGDTILLENIFDFSIDLKAVYNSETGDFHILSQVDDLAVITGTGHFSGIDISYTASYDDDGYSFIGFGVKN